VWVNISAKYARGSICENVVSDWNYVHRCCICCCNMHLDTVYRYREHTVIKVCKFVCCRLPAVIYFPVLWQNGGTELTDVVQYKTEDLLARYGRLVLRLFPCVVGYFESSLCLMTW